MKNLLYLLNIICLIIPTISFLQTTELTTDAFLNIDATITNCERVNSTHLEFSPAYYYDGIVFVSSRNEAAKEDDEIDENFFELYFANVNPNGLPSDPVYFSPNINSRLHEGPVSFSSDLQTIYFTRNNIQDGQPVTDSDGDINLQIFQAEKGPSEWENLQPLSFNKTGYNYAHPTLSVDGRKLYFASDMPGGFGGMDIYVVEWSNGSWGAPQNLGTEINSTGNDVFPYIHPAGVLFFSSDGHNGLGGLDIYSINLEENRPTLYNLGSPFNSPADDLGILVDGQGSTGYFASAREGGNSKDDLYYFEASRSLLTPTDFNLAINVYDVANNTPVQGAEIYVHEKDNMNAHKDSDRYELQMIPAGEDGQMTLSMIKKPVEHSTAPTSTTAANGSTLLDLTTNSRYDISIEKEGYQPELIYYSTAGKGDSGTLNVPLTKQECIVVHGSVVNSKTLDGIPTALVEIISDCELDESYTYTNLDGKFTVCLPDECNYRLAAIRDGYQGNEVTLSTQGSTIPLNPVIMLLPTDNSFANEPVRKGTVFIFDKIYYDFDKSYIRKGAAEDLDALVVLMHKYPSMEVEMVAHTDSRGTDEYNLELSLRRAESAKRYVVDRGIASDRINAFGSGELFLRNECKDGIKCSEVAHQYNRRTEIKVIDIDEPVSLNYVDKGPEVIDRK